MTPSSISVACVLAVALGVVSAPSGAQAPEKVWREGQVTQQALIDALAPADPAGAADANDAVPRSRSFRPGLAPAVRPAGVAAPAQRASILVTFVTNSADLTAGARESLDVLAAAMKSARLTGVRFTIEGHADPRGTEDFNLKLSQARADGVRHYLLAQHGLAAERVNAVGKGSSALLNPAEPAAPENRRVTIVALPG